VLFRLVRSYNDLGEEYYEYRNQDSSEIMIKKAIGFSEKMEKDFPDSAATYAYLAMSYGNQALYEGGKSKIKLAHQIEDNAKKSIQLNPNQYLSYVILGIYYRQIADLSWFERMFANTFFGKVPDGSFEESVQMLNKALKIKPNTIVASFQLALTYKAMGEEQKEKNLLEALIKYPQKNFRDKFAIKKAKSRLKELG
jgi:tetratricopeptide (TPR) repeat protein